MSISFNIVDRCPYLVENCYFLTKVFIIIIIIIIIFIIIIVSLINI